MAQQHQLNGTNINYVNSANWEHPVIDESLNIIATHQRWRPHIWRSASMTTAEWATLIAQRGATVSLTTTDPDDRNADYVTYYGAVVQEVSHRRHAGLNILDAVVKFMVKP